MCVYFNLIYFKSGRSLVQRGTGSVGAREHSPWTTARGTRRTLTRYFPRSGRSTVVVFTGHRVLVSVCAVTGVISKYFKDLSVCVNV